MADLARIKGALEKLAKTCRGKGPTSECPILDAIEKEGGRVDVDFVYDKDCPNVKAARQPDAGLLAGGHRGALEGAPDRIR